MITEREKSAGRTTNHESKLPNGKAFMTTDDIIFMAREAGLHFYASDLNEELYVNIVERFANLVAAHEREACRLIVIDNSDAEGICCTDDVLEAFRQRGET